MASVAQLMWLKSVVPAAQVACRKWGVPASVTLAQCITESSWGTSELATKANNFFGIKASHLSAPDTYAQFPTWEYEDGQKVLVKALFERYPDAAGSFDDHGRLLATAARYKAAMASAAHPQAFAVGLAHAGYSTNPVYAQNLMTLMREFDLLQYDPPAPAAAEEESHG